MSPSANNGTPSRESQQDPALNDPSERARANDPRVEAALVEFHERLERGETVDRETFLAERTEIADELRFRLQAAGEVRTSTEGPVHAPVPVPSPSHDAPTDHSAEAWQDCPDPIVDRMSNWMRRGLPIGTGVLVAFFLRDVLDKRWAEEPDSWLLISQFVAMCTFAISTICLYRVRRPSFGLLRGIEVACVSVACAFMAVFEWSELREFAPRFLMMPARIVIWASSSRSTTASRCDGASCLPAM